MRRQTTGREGVPTHLSASVTLNLSINNSVTGVSSFNFLDVDIDARKHHFGPTSKHGSGDASDRTVYSRDRVGRPMMTNDRRWQ